MSPTSTPPAASSPVSSPPSPWEPPRPAESGPAGPLLAATQPGPTLPQVQAAPLEHPTVWTPTVPAPLSAQPARTQAPPAPYPPQPPYAPVPPRVSPPPPPFVEAGRSRRGPVLLAAGLVAALLVGAFVVVLLLRPGTSDPASAGSTAGPSATSDADGRANADHGVGGTGASSSASPNPSASVSSKASPTSAKNPNRDDFTAATLDTTMWKVYGSNFSPNMVRVSGGELQVLGSGQDPTGTTNKSGGLCWCPNGDHKYGVWQVRAKFDAGAGYRPAIQLWPASNNNTTDGSINFANDSDAARTVLGVAVHPAGGGTAASGSVKGTFTTWHVYRVEWRATFVRMYLDGTLIFDSTKVTTALKIPTAPMHLTIQLDKGPGGSIPSPNAQTPVPVILHVDWVSYST